MGQFSMIIMPPTGSVLSDIQRGFPTKNPAGSARGVRHFNCGVAGLLPIRVAAGVDCFLDERRGIAEVEIVNNAIPLRIPCFNRHVLCRF